MIISKRNKPLHIILSFLSILLIGITITSINPVYPTIAPSTISSIDTSQIVFITAANENNQPVANCLEKDFDEQDECVNDGDNIIFTISIPADTVTQQCQLNFTFDNHPRDTPFTCDSSFLINSNSIPDNLGKLQLTVTATNQGNEQERAVFQWLQSDGGGGGGDQADLIDTNIIYAPDQYAQPIPISNSSMVSNSSYLLEWDQSEGNYNKGLILWNDTTIPITFKESDGTMVIEGDIVLNEIKSGELEEAAIHLGTFGNPWNNIVPYYFDPSLGSQERDRITQAVTYLNNLNSQMDIDVKFILIDPLNPLPIDRVVFTSPGHGNDDKSTCKSPVGKKGGIQKLWIGENCKVGNIVHEMLHTLGLYHEMARDDSDRYIYVNFNNIPNIIHDNFKIKLCGPGIRDCAIWNDPYDYCSIMHYPEKHPKAFNKNIKVITATQPVNCVLQIGQREGLSGGDIEGLRDIY